MEQNKAAQIPDPLAERDDAQPAAEQSMAQPVPAALPERPPEPEKQETDHFKRSNAYERIRMQRDSWRDKAIQYERQLQARVPDFSQRDPSDFTPIADVKPIVDHTRVLEEKVNHLESRLYQMQLQEIDRNGYERFDDYGDVTGRFAAELSESPDKQIIINRIMSSPDPAKTAYLLAGGELQDKKPKKAAPLQQQQQPPAPQQQKPQVVQRQAQSLSAVPTGGTGETDMKRFYSDDIGDEQYVKLRREGKIKSPYEVQL